MTRRIFQISREHPIPEATPRIAAYKEIIIVPESWEDATCRQLHCTMNYIGLDIEGYSALIRKGLGKLDRETDEILRTQAITAARTLFRAQREGRLSASVEVYEDGRRGLVHINFAYSEDVGASK